MIVYEFTKEVEKPFEETVAIVSEELKKEGFGKFELPCSRSGKMMIFDSTILEIKEKLEGIFRFYSPSRCPK